MTENLDVIGHHPKERIGVTGSHGHIGSHLVDRLTSEGKNVVRLDRQGNVPYPITSIYDLASYGNKYDQIDTKEIHRANVERVNELLSDAIGVKSIVLVSSSSVLLPVQTPYSQAKHEMEENVKQWVASTGDPIIIARPSTIVGIGEDENHLIPKLIHSAFTGEEMDFTGSPTHDFLGVDDFVEGLIFLSNLASTFRGHVFNVSFGVSITNEQVKDIVSVAVGKVPNIRRVDSMRSYDTEKWEVPNDKIRTLGWRPTKTVIDVIKGMVEDYKVKHEI